MLRALLILSIYMATLVVTNVEARTLILGGSQATGLHKALKLHQPNEKFTVMQKYGATAEHWRAAAFKQLRSGQYDQVIWFPNHVEIFNGDFIEHAKKILWPAVESGKCVTIIQPVTYHADKYRSGDWLSDIYDHQHKNTWRYQKFVSDMNAIFISEGHPADVALVDTDSTRQDFQLYGFSADNMHLSRWGVNQVAATLSYTDTVCNRQFFD